MRGALVGAVIAAGSLGAALGCGSDSQNFDQPLSGRDAGLEAAAAGGASNSGAGGRGTGGSSGNAKGGNDAGGASGGAPPSAGGAIADSGASDAADGQPPDASSEASGDSASSAGGGLGAGGANVGDASGNGGAGPVDGSASGGTNGSDASGTGGAAAGGASGAGGASSGGAVGAGGTSSGGAVGVGGASSGGAVGAGGASSGGAIGAGGTSSGGAVGAGGAATGGAPGAGGASDAGPPCPGNPDPSADIACTTDAECCASGRVCGFRFGVTTATFCAASFPAGGALGDACSGTLYPNSACFSGICSRSLGGCTTLCQDDADCGDPAFICRPSSVNGVPLAFCARACTSDSSCGAGQICVLRNNVGKDRLDQYCVPAPLTGSPPGTPTTDPADCDHGLSLTTATTQYCTALCATGVDCPAAVSSCGQYGFLTPVSGTTVMVGLCSVP